MDIFPVVDLFFFFLFFLASRVRRSCVVCGIKISACIYPSSTGRQPGIPRVNQNQTHKHTLVLTREYDDTRPPSLPSSSSISPGN